MGAFVCISLCEIMLTDSFVVPTHASAIGLGHTLKYNRLLQIADEVGSDSEYVGARFLSGLST